jgi:caspase domain-containing protein
MRQTRRDRMSASSIGGQALFARRLFADLLALVLVTSGSGCAVSTATVGGDLTPSSHAASNVIPLKVAIVSDEQFSKYQIELRKGLLGHEHFELQPGTTKALQTMLAASFDNVTVVQADSGKESGADYLVYPSLDVANATSGSITGVTGSVGLEFREPKTGNIVAEFHRESISAPACIFGLGAIQPVSSSADLPVVEKPSDESDQDSCKSTVERVLAQDIALIASDIRNSPAFAYARADGSTVPSQASVLTTTKPQPHAAQFAGPRVALVIGNSNYKYIPYLNNPSNDARLMATTLQSLGFKLIGDNAQINLDKAAFDREIQDFGDRLHGSAIAVFYYAGHGVQVNGENYLVPISANPARESDVYFEMISAQSVLRVMHDGGARLNIVVLDACRNNPFGGRGIRAASGGLAQMHAPGGTLISYATQPENVASDGVGDDSPYSEALAGTMREPGLDIFSVFNEVGLIVKKKTDGAQQPWISSSPIEGDFYFSEISE